MSQCPIRHPEFGRCTLNVGHVGPCKSWVLQTHPLPSPSLLPPGATAMMIDGKWFDIVNGALVEFKSDPCRIYEHDGAFKCYTHNKMWGAVSNPDKPCEGWEP